MKIVVLDQIADRIMLDDEAFRDAKRLLDQMIALDVRFSAVADSVVLFHPFPPEAAGLFGDADENGVSVFCIVWALVCDWDAGSALLPQAEQYAHYINLLVTMQHMNGQTG